MWLKRIKDPKKEVQVFKEIVEVLVMEYLAAIHLVIQVMGGLIQILSQILFAKSISYLVMVLTSAKIDIILPLFLKNFLVAIMLNLVMVNIIEVSYLIILDRGPSIILAEVVMEVSIQVSLKKMVIKVMLQFKTQLIKLF